MASSAKFERPPQLKSGRTSERDLDIIEAILRYRFSPTSELARLVGGNEDVMNRRLRMLWESGIINRFAFPFPRPHSELMYYLDKRGPLELLVQHQRLTEIHPQMEEELRLNREADYEGASVRGQQMKLGFLQHSLMISRLQQPGDGPDGTTRRCLAVLVPSDKKDARNNWTPRKRLELQ